MPRLRQLVALLCLLVVSTAYAHIGSPDTFVQASAGPYTVLLSIHPPTAYPGAAQIDLRAADITSATVAFDSTSPQSLQSFGAGVYTTSLWTLSSSAHFLHLRLNGEQGSGALDITLPANPTAAPAPHRFRSFLRILLLALALPLLAVALFLLLLAIGIDIRAGAPRGRFTFIVAVVFLDVAVLLLFLRPSVAGPSSPAVPRTQLDASLNSTGQLHLTLTNPKESFLDLVPDHGKLMHLFLIRQPRLDLLIHLHPTQQKVPNQFDVQLPAMPPGAYTLYADLYHATGVEDTATLTLGLPGQFSGPPLPADDSFGNVAPISTAAAPQPPAIPQPNGPSFGNQLLRTAHLLDGYTMQLATGSQVHPLTVQLFTVTLLDPAGQPAKDMALYLGMNAHAVVYRADGAVFAHIHPGGTLPVTNMPVMNMDAMSTMTPTTPVLATATIPYGFPSPGLYRLFVQMKHGKIVETAAFDLNVQ